MRAVREYLRREGNSSRGKSSKNYTFGHPSQDFRKFFGRFQTELVARSLRWADPHREDAEAHFAMGIVDVVPGWPNTGGTAIAVIWKSPGRSEQPCPGIQRRSAMAHMVRYWTIVGDRFAPTVSKPVNAKSHSPADVTLVTALLHLNYSGSKGLPLPPGARGIIKPSGTFTSQTSLFITAFQMISFRRADGTVSALPAWKSGYTPDNFVMFRLYSDALSYTTGGDPDSLLTYLKNQPNLHNLDSMVQDGILPTATEDLRSGSGTDSGRTGPGTGTSEGIWGAD
jgi:hypothetical protein